MPFSGKKMKITYDLVKEYYNNCKETRWTNSEALKNTSNALFNSNLKGDILEIGCGNGFWTQRLINWGNVIAIDISKNLIEQAKRRKINANFLTMNFIDFHGKFDTVVLVRVFEYFPDKKKAVAKLKELLKPNGNLIIITKNKLYWKRIINRFFFPLLSGCVTPAKLKRLLKGFKVEIEPVTKSNSLLFCESFIARCKNG